jgi:hypothetical protein
MRLGQGCAEAKKMEKFRNALKKLRKAFHVENEGYWVTGSGLVLIPKGRVNEIPKAIAEYYAQEVKHTMLVASMRRV